ncbi:MAG: V-type ATP synthase subunit K [Actinobacteria bacterium]|nr:MAG: V-type ATP synthase subunit K [Actinomycetota bacterium]
MQTFLGLTGFQWALFGAGLAAIGGGIGSAIGITYAAQTGAGVLTEDPDKFGALLPIVAVSGTQGIYGFITAVLVLIFFNLLGGGGDELTAQQGVQIFFACLPVAFLALVSAIYQGLTSSAAAGMVARRTGEAGKALILPALVETYAVLALIVTIMMLLSIQAGIG